MTRFEKWLSQQDRVDLICNNNDSCISCEECILFRICDKYKYIGEGFRDEAEAYLNEEVDE